MKFNALFLLLITFACMTAQASEKKYILAFDKPMENVEDTKKIVEKCTGILSVKYCVEAKAFLLEVDEVVYTKMELLEIYVRPDVEKITKNKFYFSDQSNPHFAGIICN